VRKKSANVARREDRKKEPAKSARKVRLKGEGFGMNSPYSTEKVGRGRE